MPETEGSCLQFQCSILSLSKGLQLLSVLQLSREELERSHRQMLREHLQLERSHALLQAHAGSSQDPYRELQVGPAACCAYFS